MNEIATADDNATCALCGKVTSLAMIGHHLVEAHGYDADELVVAEIREQDWRRYSYWRVWVEGDLVRVARDDLDSPPPGPKLQPQHLDFGARGQLGWFPHEQGGQLPTIPRATFAAWLAQEMLPRDA